MLPQFGFSEFLLLAVAALIIVGPKDLPVMMRKIGQMVAKGRAAAREFQAAFDDIARQTELDDLRKEIEDLKQTNMLSEAQADMAAFEREVNAEVMRDPAAEAGAPGGDKTGTAKAGMPKAGGGAADAVKPGPKPAASAVEPTATPAADPQAKGTAA
ncbi:MAG: Sec-independent protein translocase protein TatB [Pseudomonadota bacterium]